MASVTCDGVGRLNACRAHPLGGGWVWTCRRVIDARIEESRREKLGRIHRLNCGAQGPSGLGGNAKRNVDPDAFNEGRNRSKNRTGQDHAD
ncbi:hypothetical protein EAS54_20385 [Bradyrhizobium guangzhouense]|nr:hypothetical protein EAS54_20385 [Bradyrhizobium guangzhouense]